MYLKKEIQADYEAGYSLDIIANRYKKSQEIDCGYKITSKKAYQKVCEIIYDFIMERGFI